MDLNRDNQKQNKILRKYSSDLYAKWIPCTYLDENGVIQGCELEDGSEGTGRWGIYTRGVKSGKEYLIYIAETPSHNFRDISYDYDMSILHKRDKNRKKSPYKYNQVKEIQEANNETRGKEDKRFSEEAREKAKEMWGPVTGRPYITAGMEF